MNSLLDALLNSGVTTTCSVDRVTDNSVALARSERHLVRLADQPRRVAVITDRRFDLRWLPPHVTGYGVADPLYEFVQIHNALRDDWELDIEIDPSALIHPSAVIGVPGLRLVKGPKGDVIHMKHVGNIVIEADVRVGPQTVVHRAVLDSTIIRARTVIGSLCNIGHNVDVGEDCIITVHVSIGGSTKIGRNCWLGMGVMVRNGINICKGVLLGAGAVVVKDIDRSGKYVGNPAERIGEWDGRW